MSPSRLTERQKAQIVEQYRAGSSSVAVGKRFGCSDRTVMRLVQARLSAADLEARKEQSRKQPPPLPHPATASATATGAKPAVPIVRKPTKVAGGGPGRLTELQKTQIVEQYRAGSSSVAVGKRFGCSDRTVMRLVQARLSAADLEARKEQSRKQPPPLPHPATASATASGAKPAVPIVRKPTKVAGGGPGRLTELQKAQIVEQYRAGSSSVAVGKRFGCSDRTVMRLVQARLSAADLEARKEQSRKQAPQPPHPATASATATGVKAPAPAVHKPRKVAGGGPGRLTELQKAQIVEQYRAGSSSGAVGKRFGCSDRTVMRLVQARLSAADLEARKEQSRKQPPQPPHPATASATASGAKPAVPIVRKPRKVAGGGPGRLTELQKTQIVEQYRAGSSSVAVGKRFGCSDRTVMRLVQARLSAADLEARKEQSRKQPPQPPHPATASATATGVKAPAPAVHKPRKVVGGGPGRLTELQKTQIVEQYRAGSSSVAVGKRFGCSDRTVMRLVQARLSAADLEARKEQSRKQPPQPPHPDTAMDNVTGANSLPWEDADDFVENEGGEDDGAIGEEDTTLLASSRRNGKDARQSVGVVRATTLDVNQLPSPLYLLVERSVELQPQTLGSLHHLDPLDTDEQQRQGLILFSNVRQARRQCRRNQRIVKVADPKLLGKTAPHLLAQGISRLVIEGALYALPSSTAVTQS